MDIQNLNKGVSATTSCLKKRLLIINRKQFGYHIDTYYYCKYLSDDYEVSYIGWDYNEPRIEIDGVQVKYISRNGMTIVRYLRFLWNVLLEVNNNYDICFVKYYYGCSFLKLFYRNKNFIFDVRTGSVNEKRYKRIISDYTLKTESYFFDHITVISKCLARKFGFNTEKVHVLPLGAELNIQGDKLFHSINLLYVGTLHNRRVEDTIIGLEKFYKEFKHLININYKIIGGGYRREEQELRAMIKSRGLEGIVDVLGHIKHDELKPFFKSQNIGVSYIPITEYFDCQPPTKTFEYGLAGMPTIATATSEHKNLITPLNGVIIDDNKDGFYKGLVNIMKNLNKYDSKIIQDSFKHYHWSTIVKGNLDIFLQELVS